ncbi:MAG TPA: prenyltransferase/squalene oxidase repeat-containing protein, partial [Urbifossiella sp.]|nr:prenyltransferase/squalene oxidase repeat-containing protein [Urbifossiella sp.]
PDDPAAPAPAAAAPQPGAAAPQTADQRFHAGVAAARRKAVAFLTDRQTPDGSWEAVPLVFVGLEGGETALVTLALLEAGVPPDAPPVKKAVEYLARVPAKRTYVVGLQTRVLARADPKAHAARIQANADWLVAQGIGLDRGRLKGWSYPGEGAVAADALADQSNTHFAVFGLHAAAGAGAKVTDRVWPAVRDLYVRTRRPGGWTYHPDSALDSGPTYCMTAAALTGLAIADQHSRPNAVARGAFDEGMRALLTAPVQAPKSIGYQWLVTAELGRVVGAAAFKSGDVEVKWYREGAEKLVADQRPDGSWVPGRGVDAEPVLGTAFGLYFLGPPGNR